MGDRIPSRTVYFDLRARYRNKIGTGSAFIQDVGRCAGHHKFKTTVFLSNLNKDDLTEEFIKQHQLLTGRGVPTRFHPCYRPDGLYFQLLNNLVILDAEPQIGKTGVMIWILQRLHEEFAGTLKHNYRESIVLRLTRKWSTAANVNRADFIRTFGSHTDWSEYHDAIIRSRLAFEQFALLQESIIDKTMLTVMTIQQNKIADCGCGMHGIVTLLRQFHPQIPLEVHGFDVSNEITKIPSNSANVTFIPHVGDMSSPCDVKFAVVLYCMSLFCDDISGDLKWAIDHLFYGGILFIVDLTRRFPPNFIDLVHSYGFQSGRKVPLSHEYVIYHFSANQPTTHPSICRLLPAW